MRCLRPTGLEGVTSAWDLHPPLWPFPHFDSLPSIVIKRPTSLLLSRFMCRSATVLVGAEQIKRSFSDCSPASLAARVKVQSTRYKVQATSYKVQGTKVQARLYTPSTRCTDHPPDWLHRSPHCRRRRRYFPILYLWPPTTSQAPPLGATTNIAAWFPQLSRPPPPPRASRTTPTRSCPRSPSLPRASGHTRQPPQLCHDPRRALPLAPPPTPTPTSRQPHTILSQ